MIILKLAGDNSKLYNFLSLAFDSLFVALNENVDVSQKG